MQPRSAKTVRQSIALACFCVVGFSTANTLSDGQGREEGRSRNETETDYRRHHNHTPAVTASRKLLLLASLDGRFSQPEAAISGVMDRWLDIRNYRTGQQLLKAIPAKRRLGWTSSGFDLDGFETFCIVDTGSRHLVVWANYNTLVVTSLTKDDVKTLEPLWKDFSTRIGTSHIEEPDKGMILGGPVGVMTIKEKDGERFLFAYDGFRDTANRKWSHILRHAKTVAKIVSGRTKTSIEPFSK